MAVSTTTAAGLSRLLGGVAQSFFELDSLRVSKLDVFPLGVPVIDELLIDIEVAPGFR